jgi:hypothetical protein
MGITLHYRATLRNADTLAKLTAELEDICLSMEWKYKLTDQVMDAGIAPAVIRHIAGTDADAVHLKGIIFWVHEQAEAIYLTFDQQNRLLAPINVIAGDVYPTLDDMFWAHTKTQFAGPDSHAVICRLLRYLSDRYFDQLEVLDEANYWESQNVEELQQAFNQTASAIEIFKEVLDSQAVDAPKTVEELAQKIEELFRKIIDRRPGKS